MTLNREKSSLSMNGTKKFRRIPIMELFGPTIQGEGLMSGTITHFLRTGGCGMRCNWCDTMFAVDPALIKEGRVLMTVPDVLDAIAGLPFAPYITLTGGDPCLHKGLGEMIPSLNARGMRVAIETQGQLFPSWLKDCDVITFSPKPPSAGEIVEPENIATWIKNTFGGGRRPVRICIKVVIFDEEDFEYALSVYDAIPAGMYDSFYFTGGTLLTQDVELPEDAPEGYEYTLKATYVLRNFRAVATEVLRHQPSVQFNDKVHIGCQQHVLLWPDKDKGV